MARNEMDNSILEAALIGYQKQLEDITAAISDIRQRLGTGAPRRSVATTSSEAPRKKHRISAEGRARIAAAQKKRWAAAKKAEKAAQQQ